MLFDHIYFFEKTKNSELFLKLPEFSPGVFIQSKDYVKSRMLRPESPTTRGAGGLDFSAIGGKKQRHTSDLIGASNTV